MPTSVTVRQCPAGSEGGLLRSGRGRMPVMSLQSEGSQRKLLKRHWCSVRLHQRAFTRTLKIWIRGSSKAITPNLLGASGNGGCSTEPRQPPHSPSDSGTTPAQGCAH
ncbi:unnamed protein product [Pleuronectes platessa]|uniref:Uncharacterized protein n=1 Tax=Pleuronectes platessa TaxID=8262 RepID=A0A9N7YSR1_PLEPL|nr:unnamed protein product [Pleuronectes platessa]